jgi:hypothetical protein
MKLLWDDNGGGNISVNTNIYFTLQPFQRVPHVHHGIWNLSQYMYILAISYKIKGKVIPVHAWTGP